MTSFRVQTTLNKLVMWLAIQGVADQIDYFQHFTRWHHILHKIKIEKFVTLFSSWLTCEWNPGFDCVRNNIYFWLNKQTDWEHFYGKTWCVDDYRPSPSFSYKILYTAHAFNNNILLKDFSVEKIHIILSENKDQRLSSK